MIWGVAFMPLLNHIKRYSEARKVGAVRARLSVTTTAPQFDSITTRQIQVRIDGVMGPANNVITTVTGANGVALANAEFSARVAGNRAIVVDVFFSEGALVMPLNVVLGPGFWHVKATLMLTRNSAVGGAGYANNLSVEALSVP